MAEEIQTSPGKILAERLVRALEAGLDAGGQTDAETGKHFPELLLSCTPLMASVRVRRQIRGPTITPKQSLRYVACANTPSP